MEVVCGVGGTNDRPTTRGGVPLLIWLEGAAGDGCCKDASFWNNLFFKVFFFWQKSRVFDKKNTFFTTFFYLCFWSFKHVFSGN